MPRSGMMICLLGIVALAVAAQAHAQDSEDMSRCAELEGADARLACYDEVAGREKSSGEESIAPAPSSEAVPLTQEVGAEQLSGKNRPESEPEAIHGRVTECKKDANNKYYFVFDNGQVWKQRSTARLPVGECEFAVTITKDSFGYKMQIDGEGKKIRIGRIR